MSSTVPAASPDPARVRGRRFVIVLLAVCAAPVIAAALAIRFWVPEQRMNYGELVGPRPLPELTLRVIEGGPLALSSLRGRWVMLQVDESACDPRCRAKLERMREVRHAQGRDRHRIERLWLVADDGSVDQSLTETDTGLKIARLGGIRVTLPGGGDPRDHIYLVDPLGNVMLRFPRDADRARMHGDLRRLLRVSRIG